MDSPRIAYGCATNMLWFYGVAIHFLWICYGSHINQNSRIRHFRFLLFCMFPSNSAGSLVGSAPCVGALISPPAKVAKHKVLPTFSRFSRGAAPREEGRRGPRSGPAGAALGGQKAGNHMNRFMWLPRFPKHFGPRAGLRGIRFYQWVSRFPSLPPL